MFNGVPDWVYEEEVFSADYSLWWSPDSKNVAYLSFDETSVDEYTFPIYNPTEDSHTVVPYPQHVTMKYPKPGYQNPLVSIHVFQFDEYLKTLHSGGPQPAALASASLQLDWNGRQSADDSIIQEIAWVGNSTLLVREVNRAGNNGSVSIFDLTSTASLRSHGNVVRRLGKNGEQGDDGWIDAVCSLLHDFLEACSCSLHPGATCLPGTFQLVSSGPVIVPRYCSDQGRLQPHRTVQPSK